MIIQDRLNQLNLMCVKDIPHILGAIEIAKNELTNAYNNNLPIMKGFYTCHVINDNVCLRLFNPVTRRGEHGLSKFIHELTPLFIKHVIKNIEFYNSGKTYGDVVPQLNSYDIISSNFILNLVCKANDYVNPEFGYQNTKLDNGELYKLKLEWLNYLENHFNSLT